MDELVKELLEVIKRKDEEISRLTNIVLEKTGYLSTGLINQTIDNSPTRIRTGRQPWNDIREKMESLHRINSPQGLNSTPERSNWEEKANKAEFELFDLENKNAS